LAERGQFGGKPKWKRHLPQRHRVHENGKHFGRQSKREEMSPIWPLGKSLRVQNNWVHPHVLAKSAQTLKKKQMTCRSVQESVQRVRKWLKQRVVERGSAELKQKWRDNPIATPSPVFCKYSSKGVSEGGGKDRTLRLPMSLGGARTDGRSGFASFVGCSKSMQAENLGWQESPGEREQQSASQAW